MEQQLNLRSAIFAAVIAFITHLGFYISPPPMKPAAEVPVPTKPAPKAKPEPKATPTPKAKPKPPAEPEDDTLAAIGRIQFGNGGCTATIIRPKRPDGKYDVLTAAHCVSNVGQTGKMFLRDGRTFAVKVAVIDKVCDCCWLLTDGTQRLLPTATLAASTPMVGQKVWHAGFGIDRPGNREDGMIEAGPNGDGQVRYRLSVSPGDSGGAIALDSNGRVLSPVCCTTHLGQVGQVWGASPESCTRLRPKAGARNEWVPVEMPLRMPEPSPVIEQTG